MADELFFHVDLDAFFAAVEVLDNPSLRGKPLIIGHEGPRSVVSTCSYEARKFGVHSAMPMTVAMKLCPQAVVIHGRMKRYSEKSKEVMAIIKDIAPSFIQASIDEAYLDMSGTERLYSSPKQAALLLKDRVRNESGLNISVGVGSSRFIAKLASDYRKPDGLTIVPPGMECRFVDAVGLRKLWGIGKVTYDRLVRYNIRTVSEMRDLSEERLQELFGLKGGSYLYKVARGIDPGIYSSDSKSHSISSERTFYPDLISQDAIDAVLMELSQEVSFRSLDEHFVGRTVGIKIRYGDFTTINVQTTPQEGIYNSEDIFIMARKLFLSKYKGGGVRLIGVGLYQMYEGDEIEQGELFNEVSQKKRQLERTIMSMNKKGARITKASSLIDIRKQ